MTVNNPDLIKRFLAGAVIVKHRIVQFGADDDHVIQAAAVGDAMFAIADSLGAAAADDQVDVILTGAAEVEFGGAVTRGDRLTSDANGKAVVAAPAAGVNNSVIGRAMVSGVDGDIGSVLIGPGDTQG